MVRTALLSAWLAAFSLVATASNAEAMTMRADGDQAILLGTLVPSDEAQFLQLLQSHPSITTVVLWNSNGGSAQANARLTAIIEERKLNTAVAGYCVSACAMVFLSGSQRYFTDGESLDMTSLGFHGSYSSDGTLAGERRLRFLEDLVEDDTAGKADPSLVAHWLHLDKNQTVRFRYPGADGAPKTPTVFDCHGGGPNQGDYGACTPIAGPNALSMGIITSTQIVHVDH